MQRGGRIKWSLLLHPNIAVIIHAKGVTLSCAKVLCAKE